MKYLLVSIGLEHNAQLVQRVVLNEAFGFDIDAEGVVRQEWYIA